MFGLDKPKVLEEIKSKYSGTLRVMQGYGYKYVTSGVLTQSGGLINDVWNPVLKKIAKKNKTWLVLGLATGTAAQIIAKKYKPEKIVGVEIDPEMIRIGKQYFNLGKISNLEIVNASAEHLSLNTEHFDYILVDMYLNDRLPEFVYSNKFLEQLEQLGELVIFNHLYYEDWMKERAEDFIKDIGKHWKNIKLIRVLTNIMIIATESV
jgi:spermidine synthase